MHQHARVPIATEATIIPIKPRPVDVAVEDTPPRHVIGTKVSSSYPVDEKRRVLLEIVTADPEGIDVRVDQYQLVPTVALMFAADLIDGSER